MNNIFDVLEICLQEMENGADMESILARYPSLAGELRPILETSMKARSMSKVEPSPDAIRRGRARVMQHAAELRESRVAPRKRVIPAFQRLALSFTLAAFLLLSSTGLLSASASALPGENLYPVKRTWEGLRLLLVFDQQARTLLEDQFEYERLHEVNELLTEGRDETIQFAGVFMQVNGVTYVSGVPVTLPAKMQLPASGAPVLLTGQTNAQGVVEIASLDLLPDGSVVPVGNPVALELETNANSNDSGDSNNSNDNAEATAVPSQSYAMEGTLQAISSSTLLVNDLTVYLDNANVEGELCIGARVEVEGYFAADGRFIVAKVDVKGSCSDIKSNNNDNTNSNSGSNNNSGSNDNGDDQSGNDNSDDHDSNDNSDDNSGGGDDDNSGGGGGGDDNSGGGGGDD